MFMSAMFSFYSCFQSNDILGAILEGYPKTKKQLYVSNNHKFKIIIISK